MKEEQLAKELIQVWCRLMKKPVPQKTETTSRGEYGVLIYLTSRHVTDFLLMKLSGTFYPHIELEIP